MSDARSPQLTRIRGERVHASEVTAMSAAIPVTATVRPGPGLCGAFLLAVAIQPASAAPPQWWALDTMPPGTPPTVQCLPGSDPDHTMLDITIHGFWYETISEAGQTFRRLSFDKTHDDAAYQQVGRPELPAMHHVVGNLRLCEPMQPPSVQILDQVTIPGALIYPVQPSHNEDEPAQAFQWDSAFYQQMNQPYPTSLGGALGNRGRFDGLDLLAAETYPLRMIPATQTLLVAKHYSVTLAHPGPQPAVTRVITRRRAAQYQRYLANAPVISVYRPANYVIYQGEYLIITGPTFEDELQPLAEQKRRRGYGTRVVTTVESGDSCDEIRSYIAD